MVLAADCLGIANKLQKLIPGAVILDQYSNPHNPLAHYYSTYGEIAVSDQHGNLDSMGA